MLKRLRSLIHGARLPLHEAEEYYRQYRAERYAKEGPYIQHLLFHRLAHGPLVQLLRLDGFFSGYRVTVTSDDRVQTKRPVIYCPTHIGGYDIETAFRAIKKPCWLFLGDPREAYQEVTGLMLELNGVLCFETDDKKDRRIAYERARTLLQKGGSLLMFPEGVWNISPNRLVMHLYAGAVQLAIETNAEIVPIAIARDSKHYYISLGRNISYEGQSMTACYQLTDALRDEMAGLKWRLIEQMPHRSRSTLPVDAEQRFVQEAFSVAAGTFSVDDILRTVRVPKGQTDEAEAFSHLQDIHYDKHNAFLLRCNKHINQLTMK